MTDYSSPLIAALRNLTDRARTDTHAVKTAAGTPTWVKGELTDHHLAHHCNGGPTRGIYFTQPGVSSVSEAALDFDSHNGETSWTQMCLTVGKVAEMLEIAWGLRPIVFRSSGGRGVHLYVLWDRPQNTYSVRELLRSVLVACGLREGSNKGGVAAGVVEIFPKNDVVPEGKFGNLLYLPYARESELLEFDDLSGGYLSCGKVAPPEWLVSLDVPVVEKPVREAHEGPISGKGIGDGADVGTWPEWRHALMHPKYRSKGRDDWRDTILAIHHESGGSEEGRALALSWCYLDNESGAWGTDADVGAEFDKLWGSIRGSGERQVTGDKILAIAKEAFHWVTSTVLGPLPDLDTLVAIGRDGETVVLEEAVFDRERSGAIKPTVSNTVVAVRRPDLCGMRVGHDEFRDEITVSREGADQWTAMTDADVVRIRMRLEGMGFKSAPKETCRDAVVLVAAEHRYDSAQLWLSGLHWDGVPRVESFLVRYLGCEDTPYTRAVALYLWTALAGRVLVPGIKVDMVPIFEGDQGLRKSSAIEALAPAQEFFVEIDLEEKEDDTVRKLRGALVGEIAELSGLHTRALEAIKKFVVRKTEKWVPKYKEFPSTFQRRLVFIGTTNRTDILADETGNRRWLPLHITSADVEGIVAARDQLWAEGAALFRRRGVAWQDAERLAVVDGGAHDRYTVEDSWAGLVSTWLDAPETFGGLGEDGQALGVTVHGLGAAVGRGDSPFTIADVMIGALKFTPGQIDMRSQKRVGAVLRSLGYVSVNAREGRNVVKKWVRERRAT